MKPRGIMVGLEEAGVTKRREVTGLRVRISDPIRSRPDLSAIQPPHAG